MNMGIGTDLHISTHRHATLGFQTIYRTTEMNIYVHRYVVLTEVLYTIHTYGRERDGGKCAYVPNIYVYVCMYITCRPLAPSPLYPYPPLLSPFPLLHVPPDTEQPGYDHFPLPLLRLYNQSSPFPPYFFRFPVRQRKTRPYK